MLTSKVPVIQEGLDFLADYLPTHPLLKAVWVFGSVAEGRDTEDSDIDLAMLCEDYESFMDNGPKMNNWWSHLELGRPVPLDYIVREDTTEFKKLNNWSEAVKIYERP